jgi:hypothetical protein
LLFSWFCHFSCLLLAFVILLLLDDLLEFFLTFWSSSSASWGLGFELKTLCLLLSIDSSRGDWETKWSVPWLDCDESLTWRYLNSNLGWFVCFTFIFVLFGESWLLISWCAGGRCGTAGSDEDGGRSRRPGVDDREWSHKSGTRWLDDREIGWSRVWSEPFMWR